MSRRTSALAAMLAVTALTVPTAAFAADAPGTTQLVSQSSAGVQGDQDSQFSSISDDGRFVAFASLADNLVPGDTNGFSDIFVRDRLTGTTERVSVSNNGREGDGNSGFLEGLGGPSISADGRFVAFDSLASNLVRGDRNNTDDVFVRDRVTGTTTRVSVASDGSEASGSLPAISGDGHFVGFLSRSAALGSDGFRTDVFVHNLQTGVTERISQAPDGSDPNADSTFAPHLSADGRFVYFSSFADNLTADGDGAFSGDIDAFLFDRQSGGTTAVTSTAPDTGTTVHGVAEGISANGRFLTFTTEDTTFVSPDTNGSIGDVWLVDTQDMTRTLVSRNDLGVQANEVTDAGLVSNDGRFVVFESEGTNLGGPSTFGFNVYLRDVVAGTTRLVSVVPGETRLATQRKHPSMTPDGQVVGFDYGTDVFVRDIARADLNLAMAATPEPVRVRGQLTYTLTVRNDGPAGATNVTLVDTLPAAATFVSAAPTNGTCVRGGKVKTDGTLTCQLGSLAAGQTTMVRVVVSPTKVGSLSNTATVSADEIDPDAADNSATATTTVIR